jgi:hypothetical protein
MTIVNQSDHLLLARTATALLRQLDDLRGFKAVDYFPFGQRPPQGGRTPDVAVTLNLAEIETSGRPGARVLDARIVLSATSSPYEYPVHHFDGRDAPLVELNMRTVAHHRSTTTGWGTPSSRYKLAAEDIAKSLGKALVEKLNDIHAQDGPLPVLPDRFYPRYTQPPKLPLPAAARPRLITSYHGLMKANESLWRWQTTRPLPDVLKGLEEQFKKTGWKTSALRTAPNSLPHLRMLRDEDLVVIYPQRKERSGGLAASEESRPAAGGRAQGGTRRVMFAYFADRMSRDERTEALSALLDDGPPIDQLLMFESMMERSLRERFFSRVESASPASAQAWLRLAHWHDGAKRPDRARQALARCQLLLQTVADDDSSKKRADRLAEKLGQPTSEQIVPEPGDLESLGFVKLATGVAIEREVDVDQGVFFYAQVDDRLTTLLVRVVRQHGGDRPGYGLYHKQAADGSRMWGTGPLHHSSHIDGLGNVECRAKSVGDGTRFTLTVTVSE